MNEKVRQIVERVVAEADTPDPHLLAPWVLAELPRAELRPLLSELLVDLLREYIRFSRLRARSSSGLTSSPRWQTVRAMSREGYFVPGKGWAYFADLTAEDCRALAADYFDRAARNEALGKEFLEIAERLEREGKGRIGDLAEGAA